MAFRHSDTVLVAIHALGADAAMWDEYSGLMSSDIRTAAPDLFGIGGTPRHSAPPTAEDHADHLTGPIRDMGPRVVLCGCAVGGLIAATVAARLGDRVQGLILANPILQITGPAGEVLEDRAARARAGGIAAVEAEIISRAFEGLDVPARQKRFRDRLVAMSGESYADLAEGICGCDIAPALRALTCPILLVPGGQDRILPGWHAEDIAALTGRARIGTAPSGGHFMPQQAPEEFAAITRPFLQEIGAA